MTPAIRAILWAQWRSLIRLRSGRHSAGTVLAGVVLALWYGLWIAAATALGFFCAQPDSAPVLKELLPLALLFFCGLWQLGPVIALSHGVALDVRRLLIYPIPVEQLYLTDVLLRLTSGLELLLVAAGGVVGIVLNASLSGRLAPAGFAVLLLFNLFLAAGLRGQIERLAGRRRLRELLLLLFVIAVALPQLILATNSAGRVIAWFSTLTAAWWPWGAAARLALGDAAPAHWLVLLGWTGAAWFFGRWAFDRGLSREPQPKGEAQAAAAGRRLACRLEQLISVVLRDPLAALSWKELLTLGRSPRFRLVFLMGFTFGVIIFLPMMLAQEGLGASALAEHRLTLVAVYALLLLGDAIFWNIFGFDRSAAQFYFVAPQSFHWVLAGKNLAAMVFVLLEVGGVALVWRLLRMPLEAGHVGETYAVTTVFCLYLMGTGNLVSIYFPRSARPDRSMGATSSFHVRILLLTAYPVLAAPVLLAYAARYAFQSDTAFYLALGFAAALGAIYYAFALESAARRVQERREQFFSALLQGEGPAIPG